MFHISDVIPEALWPANWLWWWAMFLPFMGLCVLLWIIGLSGMGWMICLVTGIFVALSYEFCAAFWKVLMRAGMGLTATALVVLVAAGTTAGGDNLSAAQTLAQMNASAFVPFMLTGLILTSIGGIIAVLRSDP